MKELVEKNTQCGYTDWDSVANQIGYGMVRRQCSSRWNEMNKKYKKPPTTTEPAYVNPQLLMLVTSGDSNMAVKENNQADKYDAIVERAFNKRGRKMEPEEIRTLWTSDMVYDNMHKRYNGD